MKTINPSRLSKGHVIILSFIILAITSCSGSNVDLVKTGQFYEYNSTTVGQAFDNWTMCDTVTWEELETENGRKIVQFDCFAKNSLQSYLTSSDMFMDGKVLYEETADAGKIIRKGINFQTQFQVNLDDTFEISYMGASSEGYGEVDLSALGTPSDFLAIIMPNQKFSVTTMWTIVFSMTF